MTRKDFFKRTIGAFGAILAIPFIGKTESEHLTEEDIREHVKELGKRKPIRFECTEETQPSFPEDYDFAELMHEHELKKGCSTGVLTWEASIDGKEFEIIHNPWRKNTL